MLQGGGARGRLGPDPERRDRRRAISATPRPPPTGCRRCWRSMRRCELASAPGTPRAAARRLPDRGAADRPRGGRDGDRGAVPRRAGAGRQPFLKLGARRYLVISIAMVAARLVLREGRIAEAALAVGACCPVARRLPALEARAGGAAPGAGRRGHRSPTVVAAALAPIDDIRADAGYRRAAAAELLRRALRRSLRRGRAMNGRRMPSR